MIVVKRRVVKEDGQADRILRAALVGCDFIGCQKALEVPVNLHSTDHQCRRDTIKWIDVKHPHGWHTDVRGTKHFCGTHSQILRLR